MPRLSRSIPVFAVSKLDDACAFYVDKLGFTVRYREGGFAAIVRDDVELHLTQLDDESWRTRTDFASRPIESGAESFLPGTQMCRVQVDDAKALYDELAPKGVLHKTVQALTDQWWGDRDFNVVDEDNNLIVFFQKGAVPRRAPE